MRIEVNALVAERAESRSQLLAALYARVPIDHREKDEIRSSPRMRPKFPEFRSDWKKRIIPALAKIGRAIFRRHAEVEPL